jgi:hypothetical protein
MLTIETVAATHKRLWYSALGPLRHISYLRGAYRIATFPERPRYTSNAAFPHTGPPSQPRVFPQTESYFSLHFLACVPAGLRGKFAVEA